MWTIFVGVFTTFAAGQCTEQCLLCDSTGITPLCLSCPGDLFPDGNSCTDCNYQPYQCWPCKDTGLWTCACSDPELKNYCVPCPGDCTNCLAEPDYICKVCPVGHFLNSKEECQKCVSQCSSCTDLDVCQTCADGQAPVGDFCCSKGCLECDASRCYRCEDPLILLDGNCVERECPEGSFYNGVDCQPCERNCFKCDSEGCIQCVSGLGLVDGQCVQCVTEPCGLCLRDCLKCADSTCLSCLPETILAPTGLCVTKECLQGCIQIGIHGLCTACTAGYKLLLKFKNEGCCVPLCPHDQCAIVSGTGACLKCNFGFFLSGKCCVPKCPNPFSCLIFDFWGWCKKCSFGYYLGHSGCCVKRCCKQSDFACSRMGIHGNCVDCIEGYGLSADGCCLPKCTNGHLIYYSTTYGATCFKCDDGYYQLSNGCCAPRCCEKSRLQCTSYNTFGYCTMCKPGWILDSHGCCIPKCSRNHLISYLTHTLPPQWCFRCEFGYQVTSTYCCAPKCCKKSQAACIAIGLDGWCAKCADGWALDKSGCCIPKCPFGHIVPYVTTLGEHCFKCEAGYGVLANGCCAPLCYNENCLIMGINGWCEICEKNYQLNAHGCCEPMCDMPWLCVDENGYGYCKICPDGYYNHPSGCCAPICPNDSLCAVFGFDGWCDICVTGATKIGNCCSWIIIGTGDPKK